MLRDETIEKLPDYGISSLQSYVTWAEIEKHPGHIDFSSYDPLVEKILKHGLKWVPFLITGPHYATPPWFQKTRFSTYAKCLEHNRECRIQSIWNPHLPAAVHRFVKKFSNHYNDENLFESIALGISGNWGESLFPATGGFIGGFHTHPGFWCADEHAVKTYRRYLVEKYETIGNLNQAWKTAIVNFEEVRLPDIKLSVMQNLIYRLRSKLPNRLRPPLAHLKTAFKHHLQYRFIDEMLERKLASKRTKLDSGINQWLDFIDWYQESMTGWAEIWIRIARSCFPKNDLYLVTGGNGNPVLGADFAAQTKMASKYGAGIRVTNQNDDYHQSFVLSRLVASACRNYGGYFTTEEAWINRPHGVLMRIFDGITSGARGAYFKGLVSHYPTGDSQRDTRLGTPTRGIQYINKYKCIIKPSKPLIDTVILYPNRTFTFDPKLLGSFLDSCSRLRDRFDFDFIDELMVDDGLLVNYRYVIILHSCMLRYQTLSKLMKFVISGGILVSAGKWFFSVDESGDNKINWLSQLKVGISVVGRGYAVKVRPERNKRLEAIVEKLSNTSGSFPWSKPESLKTAADSIFSTRTANEVICYHPEMGLWTESASSND